MLTTLFYFFAHIASTTNHCLLHAVDHCTIGVILSIAGGWSMHHSAGPNKVCLCSTMLCTMWYCSQRRRHLQIHSTRCTSVDCIEMPTDCSNCKIADDSTMCEANNKRKRVKRFWQQKSSKLTQFTYMFFIVGVTRSGCCCCCRTSLFLVTNVRL